MGELLHAVRREGEHLAEVRVADQREVAELRIDRQALTRLLGREDVLELFEPHRRAVAEVHRYFVELDLVGQLLQPAHVLVGEELRVEIERVAGGLVVVRVVHATGDGRVVVAEDGRFDQVPHEIRALVGRPAVTDGVTEAEVAVDVLALERLDGSTQGFVVGVNVAQDAEAHGRGTPRVARPFRTKR